LFAVPAPVFVIDRAGRDPVGPELPDPKAQAAACDLGVESVRFRHTLIRSAVRQSASLLARRRVHEALAEVPRAALISGPTKRLPTTWRKPPDARSGVVHWRLRLPP
jgi:hypothetical protein